jgi:plasmid stability protein
VSTLIIRDLDDQLSAKLKREAKKRDLSVNRFLHQLIEAALRPAPVVKTDAVYSHECLQPRNDLGKYAGGWSQADEDEFLEATKSTREIDPDMWK